MASNDQCDKCTHPRMDHEPTPDGIKCNGGTCSCNGFVQSKRY